jgi:replicative DNA helicase
MILYDLTLEQRLLSALIKYPQEYLGIQQFFSEDDIYSKDSVLHRTIFTLIKQSVEKGEEPEATILSQRAANLGINFEEELSVGDYIISLSQRSLAAGSVEKFAKELKKLAIRRKFADTGSDLADKMKSLPPTASYAEIVDAADSVYNKQINHFELGGDVPVNIYEDIEALVEERGNNPITDFGMMGPFDRVNKIYGSLVREGNITVVCARAKVGKSQLAMRYTTAIADKYGVTVLHLDNGEMSKEELQFRQVAALSGVPLYLLETGKWRQAGQEIVDKIRNVWVRIKKLKFYYYCVGGMSADEMTALAKRFYYNVVGRGNKMIVSFDYLKTTGQLNGQMTEWQVVGEIIDKFKRFITKEILFDGKPMVSMFTSVQSNRSGITTNKKAENIVDDESVISLSDRIIQYCSHMFLLRKKTMDEILDEGEEFGTHKFINFAARHLGEDVAGHLEPVKIGDQLRNNFINLEFKNFLITEKGDLRTIAAKKAHNLKNNDEENPIGF